MTYEEAFTALPFGNGLVVKSCTGQALYDVLEQQFDNPTAGANRIMPVSRNVRYRWRGASGPHVVEGSLTIGGEPVKREATYRVVVNSFLADGGDGFTTLSERCAGVQEAGLDIDAFAADLGAHSPLSPPRLERIEKID